MTLSRRLRQILPDETARAWEHVVPVVPEGAYLVGGTALAAHLAHRTSRDLDFFLAVPTDLRALAGALGRVGTFFVETLTDDTLSGYLDDTKLQFLLAVDQRVLEPVQETDGIRIAGIGDLLATKLNAIVGRAASRDYFDLMVIEDRAKRSVEEGVGLAVAKYAPVAHASFVDSIVRALGYMGDVDEDPQLPTSKAQIESYWARRQPEIVRNLASR